MRANKRQSVDSAALTSAWEKVFEEARSERIEEYEAAGWMTCESFAKSADITIDAARHCLDRMRKKGRLEHKKIRATVGSVTRFFNIYRPRS
jgi:hypothetical protein